MKAIRSKIYIAPSIKDAEKVFEQALPSLINQHFPDIGFAEKEAVKDAVSAFINLAYEEMHVKKPAGRGLFSLFATKNS